MNSRTERGLLSQGAAQSDPQQQQGTGATETVTNMGWSSDAATGQPTPPGNPTEDTVDCFPRSWCFPWGTSSPAQAVASGSTPRAQGMAATALPEVRERQTRSGAGSALRKHDWLPRFCHTVLLLFVKNSKKDKKLKGLSKKQELIKNRAVPFG